MAKGKINTRASRSTAKATDKFLRVRIAKALGSAFNLSVKWRFLCSIAIYRRR